MTGRDSARVTIDYTNYRGERSNRVVIPVRIFWGCTKYHPTLQWLLEAFDLEKAEPRTFAMKDIHQWIE